MPLALCAAWREPAPVPTENRGEDMQKFALAALPLGLALGLAACGSKPEPAPETTEAPIVMKAGEWTLTRKTTGYNTPTGTPAEYKAALNQGSEEQACLPAHPAG